MIRAFQENSQKRILSFFLGGSQLPVKCIDLWSEASDNVFEKNERGA